MSPRMTLWLGAMSTYVALVRRNFGPVHVHESDSIAHTTQRLISLPRPSADQVLDDLLGVINTVHVQSIAWWISHYVSCIIMLMVCCSIFVY